jgi:hypothetical protein
MLVQDLSVALEAVSAAAEPWVGSAWREVPTFMLFFGLLFLVSFVLWVRACPFCCCRGTATLTVPCLLHSLPASRSQRLLALHPAAALSDAALEMLLLVPNLLCCQMWCLSR